MRLPRWALLSCLSPFPIPLPLLHSRDSIQNNSQLHHPSCGWTTPITYMECGPRAHGPSSLHITSAVPRLLTGWSSGSEVDLDSNHSLVTHYCRVYYGEGNSSTHSIEDKAKGGMNADCLAHFLVIVHKNNNSENSNHSKFTMCHLSLQVHYLLSHFFLLTIPQDLLGGSP